VIGQFLTLTDSSPTATCTAHCRLRIIRILEKLLQKTKSVNHLRVIFKKSTNFIPIKYFMCKN